MVRVVPEWIGKADKAPIPDRVKVRIFGAGICAKCGRKLIPGKWACDHIVALINGGEHRESNLQPLCVSPCHSDKTRADVAEKSKTYRTRAKSIGLHKPSRLKSRGFDRPIPQHSASRPIIKRNEITR